MEPRSRALVGTLPDDGNHTGYCLSPPVCMGRNLYRCGVGCHYRPWQPHIDVDPLQAVVLGQKGGLVPGFGTGDTAPALLQPGEFVINRPTVERLGGDFFGRLNAGRTPPPGDTTVEVQVNITTNQQ